MGQKALTTLMVFMTVLFFITVGSLIAADAPDTIEMKSAVYKKHTKGIVSFSHKKHAEREGVGCTDCHHVYKDGKNTWKQGDAVQKCGECHKETGKAPKEMSKKDKIKNYHQDALHENCKGCHKKMVDKKSDTGKELGKCTGCHPKK